jgi:DNA-binding GntR family transcriptional regulator
MSAGPSSAVIPHYAQIANDLRQKIKDGYYGPGALLPSRNEITAMYGVSAITARDALSVICQEGYAKAIRGRGHIVRRKRSRLTIPGRIYGGLETDGGVALQLSKLDVYQEIAPDNIALPLESGDATVWVRRAVHCAADDRQPIQIHVSWLPGLGDSAEELLRGTDPGISWPEAVQHITGREVCTVLQNVRARGTNPFEAETLGIPDGTKVFVAHLTLYDPDHRPIEHSRYAWPTDAARMSDHYTYARRVRGQA